MKRILLANALLIVLIAGCSPAPTSAAPTNAPRIDAASATPASGTPTPAGEQMAAIITATAAPSYPYPAAGDQNPTLDPYAPPASPPPYPAPGDAQAVTTPLPETARYGVEKVDAVLDSLLKGNKEALPALIVYTNAPCTKKDGLGGPPKCQGDEAEGTLVDVLPQLATEGSFMRKNNENLADLPGKVDLLGVFSVKPDFKPEQYYPAGKYGIVLRVKNSPTLVCLRVDDGGIVRVDNPLQLPDPANQPDLDSYLVPKS
jgi:hypothetical protein